MFSDNGSIFSLDTESERSAGETRRNTASNECESSTNTEHCNPKTPTRQEATEDLTNTPEEVPEEYIRPNESGSRETVLLEVDMFTFNNSIRQKSHTIYCPYTPSFQTFCSSINRRLASPWRVRRIQLERNGIHLDDVSWEHVAPGLYRVECVCVSSDIEWIQHEFENEECCTMM